MKVGEILIRTKAGPLLLKLLEGFQSGAKTSNDGALQILAAQLTNCATDLCNEEIDLAVPNAKPSEKAPGAPGAQPEPSANNGKHIWLDVPYDPNLKAALESKGWGFWSKRFNDFAVKKEHVEDVEHLLAERYPGKFLAKNQQIGKWKIFDSAEQEEEGFDVTPLTAPPAEAAIAGT